MTRFQNFALSSLSRWWLGLALACVGLGAAAQDDPPGRVARLNAQQGTVSFSPAGGDSWYEAVPNRPLTTGDRLWADRNARAELFVGSSALRLDANTAVEFTEIDDQSVRITVQQGSVQLRVRDDVAGQRVELDTGNLAFVVQQPGDYRVQVNPQSDLTHVTVASGAGTAYGENGESLSLSNRQQLAVSGRNLVNVNGPPPAMDDGFERWLAERNRAEDASVSARYVSREVVGYQQLDSFGDWQNDTTYGPVWYPRNVNADWAPYSDGQWANIAPWGWTWVDNAPWGFAPFHYGRWAQIGPRWGWVPGRQQARPVYSPALVGFIGGAAGGVGAQVAIGGGRNGVGWFPLAPGEAWRPGYRASSRYVDQANRMAFYNQAPLRHNGYVNQRHHAVTVVPTDAFGRGPIGRRDHVRLPEGAFNGMAVANSPAIPLPRFVPGIGNAPTGFIGRPAAALPPSQWQQRQQAQAAFQRQQQQQPQQQWQQLQMQQQQQQQAMREQQQEMQQRGPRGQGQRQLQMQEQALQQQAQRQEMQQRAMQGQAQLQQQQMLQQQQQQQQQAMRQQQDMQRGAQQMQAQQQQQQAMRQQQEMQQRAMQAQAQQQFQAGQQVLNQQRALLQQQQQQQRAAPAAQNPGDRP